LIRPWEAHQRSGSLQSLVKTDDSFDSRDKWGSLILPVRDQGDCGSCWAFAVAETTGDRVGIEGLSSNVYSPQDLVSCDTDDLGCGGGRVSVSWGYVLKNGLALESCIPYKSGSGVVPPCQEQCVNGSVIERTKATKVYHIAAEGLNYFGFWG
jgi:hypothetical protein